MNPADSRAMHRSVTLFRRAVRLLLCCGALHADAKERPVEPLARVIFEAASELSLELVETASRREPVEPSDLAIDRARAMVPALAALAERSPDLTFETERVRIDLEDLFRALCPARPLSRLIAA